MWRGGGGNGGFKRSIIYLLAGSTCVAYAQENPSSFQIQCDTIRALTRGFVIVVVVATQCSAIARSIDPPRTKLLHLTLPYLTLRFAPFCFAQGKMGAWCFFLQRPGAVFRFEFRHSYTISPQEEAFGISARTVSTFFWRWKGG